MTIRTFRPGDDAAQVGIYNEAAADLPKFKPATLDEIRRRTRAAEFDPGTRFFAEENGPPLGYCSFHANGRVSFPWCRRGHEGHAEALFQAILAEMQARTYHESQDKPTYVIREIRESPALAAPAREYHRA